MQESPVFEYWADQGPFCVFSLCVNVFFRYPGLLQTSKKQDFGDSQNCPKVWEWEWMLSCDKLKSLSLVYSLSSPSSTTLLRYNKAKLTNESAINCFFLFILSVWDLNQKIPGHKWWLWTPRICICVHSSLDVLTSNMYPKCHIPQQFGKQTYKLLQNSTAVK